MKKSARKLTIQESGQTIYPYTSFPNKNQKCKEHDYKRKQDNLGHSWLQCDNCGTMK